MWFRNVRVYRFTKPIELSAESLEQALSEAAFQPCGPHDTFRQGWVAPLGKHGSTLVHSSGGRHLICLRKEEKVLPSSVIKDAVMEKVEAIEAEQMRKVRRKEKDEIKEQVTMELLPQAFRRSRHTFAYLSPSDGFLVVDAGSAKQAEDLSSFLRKSLGSLPVRAPVVQQSPAFTLTGWVSGELPVAQHFLMGQEAELRAPGEEGGVIRCRGIELEGDEIRAHLASGMQVTRLAVTWDDALSFIVDEDLSLRRLKFGDTLQEKLDDVQSDDAAARFDAAFTLMTLELERLFPALFDAFGGEDRSALVDG